MGNKEQRSSPVEEGGEKEEEGVVTTLGDEVDPPETLEDRGRRPKLPRNTAYNYILNIFVEMLRYFLKYQYSDRFHFLMFIHSPNKLWM
jgi:hypothetical protein